MCLDLRQFLNPVLRLLTILGLLAGLAGGCARQPDPFGQQMTRALEAGLQGEEFLSEGKDRRAEKAFTKSLNIHHSIDNPAGSARQLNNLAAVAMARGQTAEAQKLLQQALLLNQGSGQADEAAVNLANLATLAQKKGDQARAETYLQDARNMARLSGSTNVTAQILCQMAGLALDQHDPGRAAVLLEEARPAAQAPEIQGTWNYHQGRLWLASGDASQALSFFQNALAADRKVLNRAGMGADLQGIGQAWEAQADFSQAFLYYSRAFNLYASTNSPEKAKLCLDALRRANQAGRLGHSLKLFEQELAAKQAADAPCPPPPKTALPLKASPPPKPNPDAPGLAD